MYLAKHNTISIIEKQFNREKIYKILHLRYILITPKMYIKHAESTKEKPKSKIF